MPKVYKPVGGFDKGGIVVDADPFALADNEWSLGRNVRFDNRTVSKITGEETMFTLSGGTNNSPRHLDYWKQSNGASFYVWVDSDGRVYRTGVGATQDSDITTGAAANTRTPLSTGQNYSSTFFNGGYTYIINDTVNAPRFIHQDGTQELANLPNWDYVSNNRVSAGVVRAFRDIIVAGNLSIRNTDTNAVTAAPGTIRTSNLATRGELPTWDPNLAAANTADEFDLATNEEIVDMVEFQNDLYVYTRSSIHAITLTGSTSIPISARTLLTGRGALSNDCVKQWYGRHFVVGTEDIYTYGGGSAVESVADDRIRDYFFDNLNSAQVDLVSVIHNTRQDEMWVCYPKGTATTVTEAIIWNYKNNTWTIRDLPAGHAVTYGAVTNNFASPTSFVEERHPILTNSADGLLLAGDRTNGFNGQAINAFLEKRGFDIAPDRSDIAKNLDQGIYIIRGTGSVEIAARATEAPGRPVDFDSTRDKYVERRNFSLDPDMGDYELKQRSNGRYHNLRIRSNDATNTWTLVRYNLNFSASDGR